ncbi:hypothetical protein R4B61_02715 [Fructilactobacillus vespulae]|uniref:hypothetical protein n=1 Tax=Fructilactobacillus vespulae TaxID=1249630 RepID=UPI0039B3AA01
MRNRRKLVVLMFSFLIFVSITVINVKADNVSNYQNIYDKSINLINKFNDNSKANVDAQNATNDEAKQEFSKYRQRYHYSSISGYAGDVQTIRKDKSGVWHFYYISDSGWRHVTSSDLIHFKDCGIAIKPIAGKFDYVISGSIITNENGVYKNLPKSDKTVIAAISTPEKDGRGETDWLVYSVDGGYSFKLLDNNPVKGIPQGANGLTEDNRDPYLWYNPKIKKMELFIAQTRENKTKHGIGQYVSDDGIHFKEAAFLIFGSNDTIFPNSTIIETPSISRMKDKKTGEIKDILFIGVQDFTLGSNYKVINGEGHIAVQGYINNQGIFIPDNSINDTKNTNTILATNDSKINRTDYGPDYYGTSNLFNKNSINKPVNNTIQVGWLGNWNYSWKPVKDGNHFSLPGISSFRKIYLDNGIVKSSLVKLDKSEWKINKNINHIKVSVNDKLKTMAKSQPIAQNYTFKLAGSQSKEFDVLFDIKENDGSQKFRIYRDGNRLKTVNWRTGGTFIDPAPSFYTDKYFNDINGKKITKMNVRTDVKSIEIEFPETGQVFTIMRYTLDPKQDLNVKVGGENTKVEIAKSENYSENMQTVAFKYFVENRDKLNQISTDLKSKYNLHPAQKFNNIYGYLKDEKFKLKETLKNNEFTKPLIDVLREIKNKKSIS